MTNIVPFEAGKMTAPPSHLAKFFDQNENIEERLNIPQLSFRGKVWRIVINGEEKPLLNKEGDPVQVVHIVVLDHNKARSRAYYEGAYEEGKAQAPACWSTDGEVPDAQVKEPRAKSCQACEFSKKGSKITPQGKEVTACSVFKRVALVPLSDVESEPLLLRLAQTSMWDKNNEENEAKGWYAWDQFIDMLRKHGAKHTAAVATKVKFDHRVAYPKLLFAASRWLADEEMEIVGPLLKDERVGKLLQAPETSVAARKPKVEEVDADEDDQARKDIQAAKSGKAAKGEAYDDDGEEAPPPAVKAKKAAPAPAEDEDAPPAPKKAKAAAPVEEDEEAPPPPTVKKGKKAAAPAEEDEAPAPAVKAKKAEPAKPNGKGAGLADLVSDWESE